MKMIALGLGLILGCTVAQAQRVVERHFDLSPNAQVNLDLDIADSIQVIAWDKPEAYIKTTIDVNDNKDNDAYQLTIDGTGKDVVNLDGKLHLTDRGRGDSAKHNCCCNCCNSVNVVCVAYVPAGTNVWVNSINANITLLGKLGKVHAKSISGWVDMTVSPDIKADLEMKTISGRLYSNLDFPITKGNLRSVGGNIQSGLNGGGGSSIELETISGDIFLRRAG